MHSLERLTTADLPLHAWLRQVGLAHHPGPTTPLLDELITKLLDRFRALGHRIHQTPNNDTDILFTSAPFAEPLSWREALLFTARRRFKLDHLPVVYTLIHATPAQFDHYLGHFAAALSKSPPVPQDFSFDGLSSTAHRVLIEQGLRGGPILSLERMLQAQSKSIRILLAVGEDHLERVYHFDLVGAYPCSDLSALGEEAFYDDIVLRIVTTESTREITNHQVIGESIPRLEWDALSTPRAMAVAGRELGARKFFTDMVRIEDLVHVPAVADAVAEQYSEGCFATWDPQAEALIATVTGSARPVDKDNITEDELAVIVGVRPGGEGAQVRHVDGKRNDPPSSEAVEMIDMDTALPRITPGSEWDVRGEVPVVRSKLHGHRGIRAFDPSLVEYVPLDPPFYHYLVSCATQAQAHGIKAAFSRAECLNHPDDPRLAAFTVLPGHGAVIVEKWVPGKVPFQVLWEFMDTGALEIDTHIPQGEMRYLESTDGRLVLEE